MQRKATEKESKPCSVQQGQSSSPPKPKYNTVMYISYSALLPAVAGYLFTFYNTKKTDERKAQIDRINEQVKDLYGPLLACISASKTSYDAMIRQHSPDGTVSSFVGAIQENPKGEQGHAYRHWIKTVLMPLNQKAADVIINNLNLLESATIPASMLQFVAHVSSLKVVIQQWDQGYLGERSQIPYPDDLMELVSADFKRIKKKQQDLLGMSSKL